MDYGDPRLAPRFWEKVYPEPNTGCWLWGAYTSKKGYGQYRHAGKITVAHRLSYKTLAGEIPPDRPDLDHKCRQRCCVNPIHLEPVTNQENQRRGLRNQNTAKTHCNHGHPLEGDNLYTYTTDDGKVSRHCGKCRNRRSRDHKRANPRDRSAERQAMKRRNKPTAPPIFIPLEEAA